MSKGKLAEYATVQIEKLTLDPSNARKHPDVNIEAIKGSLLKFGQQKPIVITRKHVVIAGNGTLAAAKALGWKKIDVRYTDLSGPEAIAFALADNRTSELAEWDMGILGHQLQSLYEDGFEIADIGFDHSKYLASIVPDEKLLDVSDEPKPQEQAEGAKEYSESEFQSFNHTCPKCGFEFDGKSS